MVEQGELSQNWESEHESRRGIERLQTMAFVHDALEEAQIRSKYSLDDKVTRNEPDRHFPFNRPRVGDRMRRLGEPAIVKYLSPDGRTLDKRTKPRIDKMMELAPRTSANLLSMPLWRLLDPHLLGHVEWHKLGWDQGQLVLARMKELGEEQGPTAAWQVTTQPSSTEAELEHYVIYVGASPDRTQLAWHVLQIRRWEAAGDLIGYDLALQQALRAARHPSAAADLSALQPLVGDFIATTFGSVVVPYPEHNLEFQRERLEAGRQAWNRRVLVGDGVEQPGFGEPA